MYLVHKQVVRLAAVSVLFVGIFLSSGLNTGFVAAQGVDPTFESAPCMFEGIDLGLTNVGGEQLGFECGYVTVPVRHENPDGPTLRLPVAIRPATGPNVKPDPLFLAQGGPGGDAFGLFTVLVPSTPLAAERDLVIFNQRGTQFSEPDLTCTETFDVLPETLAADADTASQIYNVALQACYDRLLADGVDISAFNSLQNAADVEAIRRALGYEEYNFYGVSYGTLLGLHLMRQNPEGLRSVILDSVAPTDVNFVAESARSEDRAYDAVFAACEAETACREAYPNLEERYFAIVDRLNESPVTLTIRDSESGESYDAEVDGTGFRGIVFQLLYIAKMHAVFPKLVADVEAGDYRYLEAMWPLFAFNRSISDGMYYSVLCAEDADFDPAAISLEGIRPEVAESAREDLQTFLDSCALWPVDLLPDSVDDPVSSDIPTLLLSGEFDPITPAYFAETVATNLTNAYSVLDSTASHGVAFQNECVNTIMLAFLNDPATAPDSSCLATQALPAALPPDAITLPLIAGVNSLDTRTVAQAGAGGVLLLIVLSAFAIWPLVFLVRAIRDRRTVYDSATNRLRWVSRLLMLAFGALAAIFAVGLTGFVGGALVDLTYATGMSVPAAAAPVLWIPIILLFLAITLVVMTAMLWSRPESGSTAGKVYYTILTLAAIGLLILMGLQGLLLPPL